jgi:hypothetical protein
MATVNWASDTGGFFQDPLQWQGDTAPSATDTADLGSDGGADYTVVSRSGVLGLALGGTETVGAIQTASNVTLDIVGDVDALDLLDGDTFFRAAGGTGGGSNAGTIKVEDAVLAVTVLGIDHLLGASATLEIGSTFNNTGTISIDGQPHLLGVLDADQSASLAIIGATSLTGGGRVVLSNEKLNFVKGQGRNAVLTNVNNTISGAGYIGAGGLSFVNDAAGVVDAEGSNRLTLKSHAALVNDGLLTASDHGALVLNDVTVANAGTIGAKSGAKIVLQSVDVEGGLISSAGSGEVVTNNAHNVIDGSASAVKIVGQVRVRDGTELTLLGTIDNTGTIEVASLAADPKVTTLEIGAAGVTLSGGGRLYITSETTNHIFGASDSATLTNVNNRIAGGGDLGGGELTLVNDAQGRIIADGKAAMVIDTGANKVVNAGVIGTTGTGGMTIDGAVDNTGKFEVSKGALTVDGAVTGGGEVLVAKATADFASGFSENVRFVGAAASGVLELADAVDYAGTVYGFSKTGKTALDLADVTFGSHTKASYSGTATGGVLTVTDGTDTAHIHLVGDYLSSTFTVSSDGHGGTSVVDPTNTGQAASAQRLVAAIAQMPTGMANGSSTGAHAAITSPMLASPALHAA